MFILVIIFGFIQICGQASHPVRKQAIQDFVYEEGFFSYCVFSSEVVKATEAFCLFHFPCFFNSFCLDCRVFLVFSNTRSLIILAGI